MTTPSKADLLTITILYDNNPYDPRLRTAWGFSALMEYKDATLLFDTGADAQTLLKNMRLSGIDPMKIKMVVISHAHGDHTGGLEGLLGQGVRPIVYLIPSFSAKYKSRISQWTTVTEATHGQQLAEGVFTTGEMNHGIPEQALVIKTIKGLALITGCAHPGIVDIVGQAKAQHGGQIHLVLGGYHLSAKRKPELESILKSFHELGVKNVAPCHCTGEQAIKMFKEEYGEGFLQAGAGRVIVV